MPAHERVISVDGLHNYRDLGGYVTGDGKRVVKYKHIYRADNISGVTDEGKKVLTQKLRVKYVIDFRCEAEKERAPPLKSPFLYHPIPIDACAMRHEVIKRPALDGAAAEQLLRTVATTFLIDFKEEYRRFFDLLLHEVKGQPAVFHCTAGKDRTGVAAALLLIALEVPVATVMDDFLLTNQCCPPPSAASIKVGECTITQDALNVLFRAQPYFLDLAFGEVHRRYGTVAAYMEKELDLNQANLKLLRSYYVRSKSS